MSSFPLTFIFFKVVKITNQISLLLEADFGSPAVGRAWGSTPTTRRTNCFTAVSRLQCSKEKVTPFQEFWSWKRNFPHENMAGIRTRMLKINTHKVWFGLAVNWCAIFFPHNPILSHHCPIIFPSEHGEAHTFEVKWMSRRNWSLTMDISVKLRQGKDHERSGCGKYLGNLTIGFDQGKCTEIWENEVIHEWIWGYPTGSFTQTHCTWPFGRWAGDAFHHLARCSRWAACAQWNPWSQNLGWSLFFQGDETRGPHSNWLALIEDPKNSLEW